MATENQSSDKKETSASAGRPGFVGKHGGINIPGTRAGLIVSIGLVILAWIAIPIARVFILGTAALGLLLGLLLWWRHSKSEEQTLEEPDRRLDHQ